MPYGVSGNFRSDNGFVWQGQRSKLKPINEFIASTDYTIYSSHVCVNLWYREPFGEPHQAEAYFLKTMIDHYWRSLQKQIIPSFILEHIFFRVSNRTICCTSINCLDYLYCKKYWDTNIEKELQSFNNYISRCSH